ncbi:MAG: uracil-DNA glycosylase [Sphaerochaetaceae bacterium]|jgi:uracil-DNA glycosylase family 4
MNDANEVQARRKVLDEAFHELWGCFDMAEKVLLGDSLPERDTPKTYPDFSHLVEELAPEPTPPSGSRIDGCSLEQLGALVSSCMACDLCSTRKHTVFGEGVVLPKVMVIGEGPGADEDATGRPFVGRAGQYLDKWLASIELSRNRDVYIANIVKCRPPQNRDPSPDEMTACIAYVKRQILLVKPQTILCIGRIASQAMLGTTDGIGKLRGKFYNYDGIPLLVTYHPAGVLRNPEYRRPVWDDLQRLAKFLNIPIPSRG